MFDATARLELEEALGYERYMLHACNDAIRTSRGICGPTKLLIPDEGPNQVCLQIKNVIGDTGAEMTSRMSPLVFSASYKLLDMVVEWTIRENGLPCPFQFSKKVGILANTPRLAYPDFLGTDIALRDVLIRLFKEALPYRNAVTHNRWGKNINGDLHFDFNHGGHHYSKVVRFDTVLAFAEGMSLLGDLLVNQPTDLNKLSTLKWVLDRVVSLHGGSAFNIPQPRYYQVVRTTRLSGPGPVVVDLAQVRSVVAAQAGHTPTVYDLTVEADSEAGRQAWEIPFSSLPTTDRLVLDSPWDNFRVSR